LLILAMPPLQLELLDWLRARLNSPQEDRIEINRRQVPLLYRRNPLAKRYRLFVDRQGQPRVTIPKRGSQREAERFAARHRDWLIAQLTRFEARRQRERPWDHGTRILFRGVPTLLERVTNEPRPRVRLGTEMIPVICSISSNQIDLRVIIETHLRGLAALELPARTLELAALHRCPMRTVSVRNQRSRWGSCSRRGAISLNWRLVQVPVEVRDYIILHELMHLKEMNHSRRFWSHVATVCPGYKQCEAWLRAHSRILL
jgi:predicted metal-dependent hydrolase